MTQLDNERTEALCLYNPEACPNNDFREKLIAEIITLSTDPQHLYFFYINKMTDEEKWLYGRVENMPGVLEKLARYWCEVGAAKTFGEQWEQNQERSH